MLILVSLKTYQEATCKGHILVKFLDSQRPSPEDVRDLSQYLNSEISDELPPRSFEYDTNTDNFVLSQQHSQYTVNQPPN